ncbi:MAG: mannose-6-phosphate isomerase, class I [Actinomycetota bacterium]
MGAVELRGAIQHYAWGDPSFLPEMLGVDPDGRPWAELWLGTHPSGMTTVTGDGAALVDLTGPLRYLLKVLCAAEPLSMQCHPNAQQAIDGFRRGVYPDDQAKPELIVALTEFSALCGLRPVDDSIQLLRSIGCDELADRLADSGPFEVLGDLYRGRIDPIPVIDAAVGHAGRDDRLIHIADLAERYPGQASVVVAILLNHVVLSPGQALHLTAGNLHAYLSGSGIELMGASDNVVRGGLTVKHVDVDELLTIVDPTPLAEPILASDGRSYALPEAGVVLHRLGVGETHTSHGHELAVALDGTQVYLPDGTRWTAPAEAFVVTDITSGV